MPSTSGERRARPRVAKGEERERAGATLFKQLASPPAAGVIAYLASAVLRHGRAPGGPLVLVAALLFLVGFAFAWLWASYAWRRFRDWRLLLAAPLVTSSSVLTFVGYAASVPCVPVRTYRVGVTPADVAIVAGAAWVTDWHQSPGRLYRLSLSGKTAVDEVALEGAFEVAGDADRLWVSADRTPEVSEVDPLTRRALATYPLPGVAADIATTATHVWMTFPDQRVVGRLDRRSHELDVFDVGAEPASVAVDGGDVWITGSTGQLYGLDGLTGRVEVTVAVGQRPYGVFARDGTVWVAATGEDAIVSYDVATGHSRRFRVAGAPSDLVVQDGRLWVTSQDAGTVTEFDARTGELIHERRVGGAPLKLELSGSDLFVTNPGTAEVHRLDTRCERT